MRPHFPSFVRLARVSAGLVRLFGIFVRCLGFYYDISAITMVRASERDTNRHIGREGDGARTRILISLWTRVLRAWPGSGATGDS